MDDTKSIQSFSLILKFFYPLTILVAICPYLCCSRHALVFRKFGIRHRTLHMYRLVEDVASLRCCITLKSTFLVCVKCQYGLSLLCRLYTRLTCKALNPYLPIGPILRSFSTDISSRSGLRSASTNRYEPHTTRLKFG